MNSQTLFLLVGLSRAVGTTAEGVGSSCVTDLNARPEPEGGQLGLLQAKHEKQRLEQSVGSEPSSLLRSSGLLNASQPATGSSAALTEEGYQIVAAQCCNWEMMEYIRRVVFEVGAKVCNEGGLMGLTPWYSCTYGPQTLAKMKDDILTNIGKECPWVALADQACVPDADIPAKCHIVIPEIVNDCGCSKSIAADIDFFASTITHSNLAGAGPDTGAQELRYTNIGTINSVVADLVVTGSNSYKTSNPGSNGKRGKFGTINLQGGNEVELTFSFMQTGTNTPMTVEEIDFTIFDLDQSFAGKMLERVYASGFDAFEVDKSAELDMEIARVPDGRTVFKSTVHGIGCDNPSDPMTLGPVTCTYADGVKTIDQRKRSFQLTFKKVSSFKFTIEATCINPTTAEDAECKSGRNFLFAGKSSLVDRCGE